MAAGCYAAPAPPGAATILSAGWYSAKTAITAALAWSQASRSLPLPRTGAVRKTTLSAPPGLLLSPSIVFYISSLFARNTRPSSQAQSPPSASDAPDVPPGKTPLASNPKPHQPVTRFPDPTGITQAFVRWHIQLLVSATQPSKVKGGAPRSSLHKKLKEELTTHSNAFNWLCEC